MKLSNLRTCFQAFREPVLLITRHRQLTLAITKREITDRYLGEVFGVFWAVGHPLIVMGIYVFIFAFVFRLKIGGTREMPLDYATYLLSGLIPWLSFQESMAKGATAIANNASLVKQVVFPIEVLPVKGVLASLVTMGICFAILILYVLISHHSLPWTYLLLPFLIFLQVLAMIGVSYFLSSIGAYFRDLKDFVQVFSYVGIYIMPIFYLPESVPRLFRPLLYLNPFSYLTWCYQDALYFGRFEHWWAWGIFALISVSFFYIGYRIFRKLKVFFGNVL